MSIRRTRMPNIAFPAAALAYVEFTSMVAPTATSAATANVVVTAGAFTADGSTRVKITFFAPLVAVFADATHVSPTVDFQLYQDGSDIGGVAVVGVNNVGTDDVFTGVVSASRVLTPAAGSRTYSIRGWVENSGDTALVVAGVGGAGVTMPGFILIERCP